MKTRIIKPGDVDALVWHGVCTTCGCECVSDERDGDRGRLDIACPQFGCDGAVPLTMARFLSPAAALRLGATPQMRAWILSDVTPTSPTARVRNGMWGLPDTYRGMKLLIEGCA